MPSEIRFLIAAENELVETVQYYNYQSSGLGFEFAVEVAHTLNRIAEYPLAWHQLSARTRRCRTNRFPYGIIYQIRKNCIMIIAVMHLHREPETWQERIKKTGESAKGGTFEEVFQNRKRGIWGRRYFFRDERAAKKKAGKKI